MEVEQFSMSEYGGYDYTFCDPLPDECPCPVCTLVQKDPHRLTCCGKIFCKSCLDELIKRDQSCPNCRSDFIKGRTYFPDTNTERKIKHLSIDCENKKQGCTWTGYLKDLKESHIPKCPYELIQCTNIRNEGNMFKTYCRTCVQRRNLQKHEEECEWRLVSCVHCEYEGSFKYIIGKHTDGCPGIPVVCTNNGCQEKVRRSRLKTHQESCLHKIVSCRYSSVGCKRKIKKKDIQSHNKERMEEHLESAVSTLERALKRIEALEESEEHLESAVSTLERALKRIEALEESDKKRSTVEAVHDEYDSDDVYDDYLESDYNDDHSEMDYHDYRREMDYHDYNNSD